MAKKEKRVYFDPDKRSFEDEKNYIKALIDIEIDVCDDLSLLRTLYLTLYKCRMHEEANQAEEAEEI